MYIEVCEVAGSNPIVGTSIQVHETERYTMQFTVQLHILFSYPCSEFFCVMQIDCEVAKHHVFWGNIFSQLFLIGSNVYVSLVNSRICLGIISGKR